ncbi:MAG: hypothetical protein IAE87_20205 [Rhodobacteraceae bacterium]|nr:hypothetical protein [Paracoccaceae bacterium]
MPAILPAPLAAVLRTLAAARDRTPAQGWPAPQGALPPRPRHRGQQQAGPDRHRAARLRRLLAALLPAALSACILLPVPIPVAAPRIGGDTTDLGPAILPTGCTRAPGADLAEARVLALVNAQRRAAGLGALRASPRLASVAQGLACDNARRGGIGHVGGDGATLGERLNRNGYRWWTAAENTGLGFAGSPDRLVAFWMASPAHRENLLNPAITEAGLGLSGEARPAWVLDLAQPR